jgi:hypothetical protein
VRSLLLVIVLSVAGCNRPVTPVAHEVAKEEPTPDPQLPSHVSVAATPQSPLPQASAAPQDHPALGFQNETANQAWNQYVEDFQAIKSLPPPQVQDPLNYLNQLGDRLKSLQHSRDAVEANLASPEEKKRFRAAEKSLFDGQEQ